MCRWHLLGFANKVVRRFESHSINASRFTIQTTGLHGAPPESKIGTKEKHEIMSNLIIPILSFEPNFVITVCTCRQKEKEQTEALRKHHMEEIDHHKKEIERLQKEIDRHIGKIRKLKHDD